MSGAHPRSARAARRAAAILLAAGALLLCSAVHGRTAPAWAQDVGWVIDRFDVSLAVGEGGVLSVTEEIAVDFRGLDRHGIFRAIPVRYPYDDVHDRVVQVENIDVTGTPGTPTEVDVSRDADFLVVRIGDPDRTVSGQHVYRISYQVRGAMNSFETHEELYWNATGHRWDVPMRHVTVTVAGPSITRVACFSGPTGSTDLCNRSEIRSEGALFESVEVLPGEGVTVVVGFAQGSVDVGEPILDERFALSRAFAATPWTVLGAGLVALVGLGVLARFAWREGRDRVLAGGPGTSPATRPLRPESVAVQFRPPDGLKPGHLGVLLDERVDNHDVSATIVDLALRGHLTIEQVEENTFLWFGRDDWVLRRREPGQDPLDAFEKRLLDGLFRDDDEVKLSALTGKFHRDYEAIQELLYADAERRGWFARRPDKVRDTYLVSGIAGTVVAAGLVFLAARYTHAALVVSPLVPLGIAFAALHRWMPRRTPKGSDLLRRTLGFREFIVTAETDRARFAEEETLFTRYLPYAVMFAAVDKWARAFADLGDRVATADPYGYGRGPWYVGSGRFELAAFSAAMSDFTARAGSSLSSRPASSGSSGFSSGGGFSGGGVGGGGGGSW